MIGVPGHIECSEKGAYETWISTWTQYVLASFLPRIQEGSEELMVSPPQPCCCYRFSENGNAQERQVGMIGKKNSAWEFEALGIPS